MYAGGGVKGHTGGKERRTFVAKKDTGGIKLTNIGGMEKGQGGMRRAH